MRFTKNTRISLATTVLFTALGVAGVIWLSDDKPSTEIKSQHSVEKNAVNENSVQSVAESVPETKPEIVNEVDAIEQEQIIAREKTSDSSVPPPPPLDYYQQDSLILSQSVVNLGGSNLPYAYVTVSLASGKPFGPPAIQGLPYFVYSGTFSNGPGFPIEKTSHEIEIRLYQGAEHPSGGGLFTVTSLAGYSTPITINWAEQSPEN